jgi:hypothetical protein
VFELAWLTDEQINNFTSDFRYVATLLRRIRTKENYPMSPKSYKHAREIIDLFRVMSQNNKKIGVIFDEFNNNREAGGTFMTEDEMYEMFDRIESRGEQRKSIEVVKSFYANGVSLELIAKSMNMTIEQVQNIVKDVVVEA